MHRVRGTAYAYATFDGEERRYGRLDDEARRLFAEDLATWLANGRRFPVEADDTGVADGPAAFTVRDLRDGFMAHFAATRNERERDNSELRYRLVLDVAVDLFGDEPAASFAPKRFGSVPDHLVGLTRKDGTTPKLSVGTINERLHLLRAAFGWAVAEELIPASVLEGLRAVPGVRRGQPGTRGSRKIEPVAWEHVEPVLPLLSRSVRALVELLWWTGARPGELFGMTSRDIDRIGKVWTAELADHKTAGKGKRRTVFFGPAAQRALAPMMLGRPAGRPMFRPVEAVEEHRRQRRTGRKTPLYPSHVDRYEREKAARDAAPVAETYDAGTLRKAVQRALAAVNRTRTEKGLDPIPRWHPYQLRHSAGTRIRKEHGIEAARTLLGHASAMTTEIYAEADLLAAAKVAEQIG